jgi:hypothetical protein
VPQSDHGLIEPRLCHRTPKAHAAFTKCADQPFRCTGWQHNAALGGRIDCIQHNVELNSRKLHTPDLPRRGARKVAGRIAAFELIHFVAVIYIMRPAYFVIRGQVMVQFCSRGQDMLKFRSGADCSGAENEALAVDNLCFNWPNYAEDLEIVLHLFAF